MPSIREPFLDNQFKWPLGESGWNSGMDENIVKMSLMISRKVLEVVDSIPQTPPPGASYYLTTDNRMYAHVAGTFYSSPVPENYEFYVTSTKKTFKYINGGLVQVKDSLNHTLNVRDLGAKGDGISDDFPIFSSAIADIRAKGGGELIIPAGKYKLNGMLELRPVVGVGFHNLDIVGEGAGATVLDFSTAPAGTDGIGIIGWGGRFNLRGFSVKDAKAIGINFNKGVVRGGTQWLSRFSLEDIIVDGSQSHNIQMVQTYMGSLRDVEARNSVTGRGFNLLGFHTSMDFTRCWAGGDAVYPDGGNVAAGWFVNACTYSHFSSCSADGNGLQGWKISNTAGVVFSACGAESNGEEGFLARTGVEDIDQIPAIAENIKGLIFDGCFAVTNSKKAINGYANFLGLSTSGFRPAQLTVRACVDTSDSATYNSIVLNGSSGDITCSLHDNTLFGPIQRVGTVLTQNLSMIGRSALLTLAANQLIPDSVETVVQINTVSANSLNATFNSNAVVIPRGVSKVRCTAGAFWDSNTTGSRVVRVFKNGATFDGSPNLRQKGMGLQVRL